MFLDSTGNLEELTLRFFMLCTHSPAGGLPLAILITSDETEKTLTMGLNLVKECLPQTAFYGKGPDVGPSTFLTDNCSEERAALKAVWPQSKTFLCVFHLLQAIWRWLLEKKNDISQPDRRILLCKIKEMIYATSNEELDNIYKELITSPAYERNENFEPYFENNVWSNRIDWCVLYRKELPLRGNNTSNYVEAQFRVMKDEVCNRVRSFNFIELLGKVTSILEGHYRDKLLSVANSSSDGIFSPKFHLKSCNQKKVSPDKVKIINQEAICSALFLLQMEKNHTQ